MADSYCNACADEVPPRRCNFSRDELKAELQDLERQMAEVEGEGATDEAAK